jgi:hypothetical protein
MNVEPTRRHGFMAWPGRGVCWDASECPSTYDTAKTITANRLVSHGDPEFDSR